MNNFQIYLVDPMRIHTVPDSSRTTIPDFDINWLPAWAWDYVTPRSSQNGLIVEVDAGPYVGAIPLTNDEVLWIVSRSGQQSFSRMMIVSEGLDDAIQSEINEEVAINYGFFIETFIDFMIVAFTIFIVIKFLNKLKIQAEDPTNKKVSTPRNIKLLTEINDSLKDLNKNLTKKN